MKFYQKSGFTIFEMIVTITIIAVMSTLFLANYRANDDLYEEKKAISEFMTTAESAVYKILGYDEINLSNEYVCGWGISIESEKEYVLFPAYGQSNNICNYRLSKQYFSDYFISKELPENIVFEKVAICRVSLNNVTQGVHVSEGLLDSFNFYPMSESGYLSMVYTYDARDTSTLASDQDDYLEKIDPLLMAVFDIGHDSKNQVFYNSNEECLNIYLKNTKNDDNYLVRMYVGGLIERVY
ncbi:MAG: type II secretion system GspH family protein [Candidatus Pacebacteria bacterium]|nr:type II secretion system GspH family protein [Candidatus Paceibacterota bacterium]